MECEKIQTFDFPAAQQGTTYTSDAKFNVNFPPPETLDLTDAVITMWLVKSNSPLILRRDLTTENSGIIIYNPTCFGTNFGVINLAGGIYLYDIKIVVVSGKIYNWIRGQFPVISTISQPIS